MLSHQLIHSTNQIEDADLIKAVVSALLDAAVGLIPNMSQEANIRSLVCDLIDATENANSDVSGNVKETPGLTETSRFPEFQNNTDSIDDHAERCSTGSSPTLFDNKVAEEDSEDFQIDCAQKSNSDYSQEVTVGLNAIVHSNLMTDHDNQMDGSQSVCTKAGNYKRNESPDAGDHDDVQDNQMDFQATPDENQQFTKELNDKIHSFEEVEIDDVVRSTMVEVKNALKLVINGDEDLEGPSAAKRQKLNISLLESDEEMELIGSGELVLTKHARTGKASVTPTPFNSPVDQLKHLVPEFPAVGVSPSGQGLMNERFKVQCNEYPYQDVVPDTDGNCSGGEEEEPLYNSNSGLNIPDERCPAFIMQPNYSGYVDGENGELDNSLPDLRLPEDPIGTSTASVGPECDKTENLAPTVAAAGEPVIPEEQVPSVGLGWNKSDDSLPDTELAEEPIGTITASIGLQCEGLMVQSTPTNNQTAVVLHCTPTTQCDMVVDSAGSSQEGSPIRHTPVFGGTPPRVITPLKTCVKPRKVGLSRKSNARPLHKR